MKYRLPEINDKDILQTYVLEHHDNGETNISASLGLSSSDYTEWVTKIKNNAFFGDEQWGKSLLYLCFVEDKLIGLLSIRYELPEVLSEKYGDIGYGVRPSERNRGYATAMLNYALSVCREKGLEKVILGCYKEGRISQYYLINLYGNVLFCYWLYLFRFVFCPGVAAVRKVRQEIPQQGDSSIPDIVWSIVGVDNYCGSIWVWSYRLSRELRG